MNSIKDYRDLIVWQKSMDMVVEVYKLLKKLPKEELYALSSQMRKAAISIPSNIAEGQSRKSTKEFLQFPAIARGSKSELETQILLCVKLEYLPQEETKNAQGLLEEVGKMLTALMQKLTTTH